MTSFQYKALTTALLLVLALVGAAAFYFYSLANAPLHTDRLQEQAVAEVIAAVGAHMVLPEGEEPTVATVTDLEELRGQPFFAQAEVGYKVLIYTKARKAILYDPTSDKIVEVAPLNLE